MQRSQGYILRTRPYSDANVIVDLLTKSVGRITCITRPAKLKGKVSRGHLQPFRILDLHWQGRGELFRLTQTDERFRHRMPVEHLMYGMYLNELILKLLPVHTSLEMLYNDYQASLGLLVDSAEPMPVIMHFEVAFMQGLGHALNLWQDDESGADIQFNRSYLYVIGLGILPYNTAQPQSAGVLLPGQLLMALRDPFAMEAVEYQQLRGFLDKFWLQLLGKPFNSRKLLHF